MDDYFYLKAALKICFKEINNEVINDFFVTLHYLKDIYTEDQVFHYCQKLNSK